MQGPGYLSHFGLTGEPFSNAPVARFYYESDQHKQALTRLGFALQSMKGLCVVVGGIGTGKTTLARRLLDQLPDAEYEAALLVIIHAGVDASWLLRRIAMQLGVSDPAEEKLALLSQLYQRLVQIYESGKKAVVLIDEAQMLATRELMEEFRGLLNLEVPERKLLSIVFFGLPEIDRILKLDPPLKQRVALRFKLEGLSRESTERYIHHRLQLAGATQPIFTTAALDVIFDSTAGTPRLINAVCDNVLMEAYLAGQTLIDAPLVLEAVDNLGIDLKDYEDAGEQKKPEPPRPSTAIVSPALETKAEPKPETKPETKAEPKPSAPARPIVQSKPAPQPAPAPAPTLIPQSNAPAAPMLSAFDDEAVSPQPPKPVAKPAIKKTTVNLDEIDSLLAQIKKPIG
jgi:general secretion pathway protein A